MVSTTLEKGNKMSNVNWLLRLVFWIHIISGSISIVMDKLDYGLPPNTGWIIILGFTTILDAIEEKK
jgi:hypothetical protein